MQYLWGQLRSAIALIVHGDPYVLSLLWVTIRVALVSTSLALAIGLPIGLALGLGRFRGRRTLQLIANASLALPSVVVGIGVLLLVLPQGALGSLRIEFTLRAVYIAQAILALPFIVALTPAAIQGLGPGLLAQARALGAGRLQLSLLALREAKIGVLAAVLAAPRSPRSGPW
jgi:tungstate transport system permease protein